MRAPSRRTPNRLCAWRTSAALTLLAGIAAQALAQPTPWAPAASQEPPVAIATEALPELADAALADGLELEQQRLWGDAVAHYEKALRTAPTDRRLERRFDISRLHNSLERRYADASFSDMVGGLDLRSATELYGEVLAKIDSHYVATPSWGGIVRRGAHAVVIAARDAEVRRRLQISPDDAAVKAFIAEATRLAPSRDSLRSPTAARQTATRLASVAQQRLGGRSAAWMLEFVAAAVGGLDNYSAFLTPDQLRDVYAQIEGNFVGLGVELKSSRGALLIVRVIPGSPAAQAGLSAGDRIVAVDGVATSTITTDEAAAMLTGEVGSIAQVTVESPGLDEAIDLAASMTADRSAGGPRAPQRQTVSVRREHVEVPSMERVQMLDPYTGVAYVRIPVFQKTTSSDMETTLWDLHSRGMRSLIIDLRGNPGGLLTASVELVDKFVAQGGIVSTRGRSAGEDFDYRAHRDGTWQMPLVVLIDSDSASASEIFAAAILDNRRGKIVGDRSFGKGSVQGIFPMSHAGAGVRLTTAKFYSPAGRPISKVGVKPDIVVRHATSVADGREDDAAGQKRTVAYRGGASNEDPALNRAVETARELTVYH
ncbi:MAG: S41 family peptidase [Planctomycetota bacterium]